MDVLPEAIILHQELEKNDIPRWDLNYEAEFCQQWRRWQKAASRQNMFWDEGSGHHVKSVLNFYSLWRLTCTLLAFPWMELLSDVLETGSSIQADRTQQVETGTGRKTANCGFHCTKFYENSFILKNSGNHQHRENYKRLDIRDDVDCPILQRAVVRLLASGSRVT